MDHVVIPPADTLGGDVAFRIEIGDDALRGAFRNADAQGDIAEPYFRVASEAEKYVSVVREKSPTGHALCIIRPMRRELQSPT